MIETHSTFSFYAASAAANARHHCDHADRSRTIRLTGSIGHVLYLNAADPDDLRLLASRLADLADEWDGIDTDDDLNCEQCGVIVPEGKGRYPHSIGGDRVCGDCFRDATKHNFRRGEVTS